MLGLRPGGMSTHCGKDGKMHEWHVHSSGQPVSFEQVFHSHSGQRDNFLARLFGIFSEHVVRTWCDCPQASFSYIGRPTLRKAGETHGYTLDFTLEQRQSRQRYAAEMKCWTTWENYRYLRLTEAAQLEGITQPAFAEFLAFARDPAAYQVFVKGTPPTWPNGNCPMQVKPPNASESSWNCHPTKTPRSQPMSASCWSLVTSPARSLPPSYG
jgi:hypothetical protein